jgi:hypothetical protein
VSGIFKVWDNRDLSLVQTFSIPNNSNRKAHTFCVTCEFKKKNSCRCRKSIFF